MSLLKVTQTVVPAGAHDAPAARNTKVAASFAAASHAATLKRFGQTALAIVLIVVIVTAIIALKSAIWIPRFHP
jgi:hypothetical protein